MFVVGLLFISMIYLINYYNYDREESSYYNKYIKRYGIPEGVGKKLSKRQVKKRACSFKLIRKGRKNPVYKVQAIRVIKDNEVLTQHHNIGTYFKSSPGYVSPFYECQWEYVRDRDHNINFIIYEKAYNKYNELVRILVYSPPSKEYLWSQSAHMVEAMKQAGASKSQSGLDFQKQDRGARDYSKSSSLLPLSSANYVIITYNKDGYKDKIQYFDPDGNQIQGPDKAYGKKYKYNDQGMIDTITSIDKGMIKAMSPNEMGDEYEMIPPLSIAEESNLEVKEYDRLFKEKGLKAALDWRQSRFIEEDTWWIEIMKERKP